MQHHHPNPYARAAPARDQRSALRTPEASDKDLGKDLGELHHRLASVGAAAAPQPRRHKYPPDQEAAAIELVLQQTDLISEEWAREDLGNTIEAAVANALSQPA